MDPISLILLLTVLAGGGTAGVVWWKRQRARQRLRRALLRSRVHNGRELSLFDVFWDLGASDYALEMMRHDGLLVADGTRRELDAAHAQLDSLIEWHGGYDQYLEDSSEAIEEFYQARGGAGRREYVPKMETRERKLLVAEGRGSDSGLESRALANVQAGTSRDLPESSTAARRRDRLGRVADRPPKERARARSERLAPELPPRRRGARAADGLIDVDGIDDLGAMDVLEGLVEGDFTDRIQSWWEERRLRSLKDDLDGAFEAMYDFYVDQVDRNPNFYDRMYAAADRWADEARRIEELVEAPVMEEYPVKACAQMLLEEAASRARQIEARTRSNIHDTIETIHDQARDEDFAMAGYLVYVNRHAFFAGRGDGYVRYARRIENLAHKVREELRQLKA